VYTNVRLNQCDDGDRDINDGCSNFGAIEPGYSCPAVALAVSVCTTTGNDGVV
jgi:cysteine-rich repeat protein